MVKVTVQLNNPGARVSLATKLTLLSARDVERILPAYYSDNYISLLPGEGRKIEIKYPSKDHAGPVEITLRGWNVVAGNISVDAARPSSK